MWKDRMSEFRNCTPGTQSRGIQAQLNNHIGPVLLQHSCEHNTYVVDMQSDSASRLAGMLSRMRTYLDGHARSSAFGAIIQKIGWLFSFQALIGDWGNRNRKLDLIQNHLLLVPKWSGRSRWSGKLIWRGSLDEDMIEIYGAWIKEENWMDEAVESKMVSAVNAVVLV